MGAGTLDPAALATRAARAFGGDARVTHVEQFEAGASSLTYAAQLVTYGNERRVVIKAAPPGLEPTRNRDVLRQARLLQFLHDHSDVAVPDVLATDPGSPVDVPPLFVMSFVPGEDYEPQLSPDRSAASGDDIAARARGAMQMAAALHRCDISNPVLATERPISLADEAGRWARAFDSVDDDLQAGAGQIHDALLASPPDPRAPAIVHGDWRLGNMLCNGPSIDAVIDWEIWSLGDPRIDLAWFLLLVDPDHPNKIRDDAGLPPAGELVAAYEEASGSTVAALDWFGSLVRYKQAAVSALIIKNNRKIAQPGVDVARMERSRAGLLVDAARRLG